MVKKENRSKILLPSVQSLFHEAWELFKNTWISYLKLFGVLLGVILIGAFIGILIALPTSISFFSSHFQLFRPLTLFTTVNLILFIIWMVIYLVAIIAVCLFFPIISIFILQEKKPVELYELAKKGKKFVWLYFYTTMLSGLFTIGGIPFFILPGLLIGFFFIFVNYEIILDGKSGVKALQRSYVMVKGHFWEVLGRLVLLEICVIIISSLLGRLAMVDLALRLTQFLFSLLSGWYVQGYTFLLYNQVRERTIFPDHIRFTWIWIISSIGWIAIILLIVAASAGLAYAPWMHSQPHMHRLAPNPFFI